MKRDKGRGLTNGEITMAKTVFKNQMDYGSPTIFHRKWIVFQKKDRAMSPNGNIYFSPDDPEYHDDFSASGVYKSDKKVLIHELGHVWQHQSGINVVARGMRQRDYDYLPLDKDTDFSALKIEQQAELLADYFAVLNGTTTIYYMDGTAKSLASKEKYEAVIPWL